MKKNRILALVTALLLVISGFSAFAETAFEDIEFPDAMPSEPTMAEESYYDYDDMSQHYDLTFFTYNYGVTPPEDDPIARWIENKFNVTIKLETATSADVETYISTAFAGGDTPDVFCVGSDMKNTFFTIGEQGLLVDATEMYPLMPQTCKFVTKTLLQYSTMADGTIPFTTKYSIQDGDIWNLAIRKDWLDAMGMEVPTTLDELLEFAKKCVTEDPDGNGVDDTYFMLAAGGGSGFGMLEGFGTAFGNSAYSVGEDGKLSAPMLNGSRKQVLQFISELYAAGTLPTDWYSIDWEAAKSYTMNDKIGMVRYPAGNLYGEYGIFTNKDTTKVDNWYFLDTYPSEEGKGGPGGNPGTLMAIPKANIGDDEGKLKRICHILDAMCYGGDAYFETVQGGGLEVWADRGYIDDVREYKDNGRSICYVALTHPGYELDSSNLALAPWQNFGYSLKYQDTYSTTEEEKVWNDKIDAANENVAKIDRWDNTGLLYTVPADAEATLKEYVNAQEYKFVVGERSFDEWDTYVQEWLNQGGRTIVESVAEQLGCELPDGI